MNILVEFLVKYGFQVIGAIVILVLGILAARWTARMLAALCERKRLDITLSRFLTNIVKVVVMIFVVIITMGKFGISIAPFIAALGDAGITIPFPQRDVHMKPASA